MYKNILIIGSLNMDMVTHVAHMPVAGETIMGNGLDLIPGGKGANQAYAAGCLGHNVTMLGCVGGDASGRALVDSLNHANVDTSYIKVADDAPTGTALIYINDKGNNSIVVIAGANALCDVGYLKANDELFKTADYVVLQMEIPYDAVYYAVKRANELGKAVVLNPAPAPESIPEDVLACVDYLTPNETELEILSGENTETMEGIEAGSEKLLSSGVKNMLVTVGSRGAMLVDENGSKLYPAFEVKAVDTTAAGDCFNAAFVVGLSEGLTKGEAVIFGNKASSIAVTRAGASSSIPSREEVDTL